jgi:hypothetical protein
MSLDFTRKSIIGRIQKTPSFAIVPEHAIKLFDRVIEENEVEALRKHPNNEWERIQFWKDCVMDSVLPRLRGLVAVQYHEYIASLMRGGDACVVDDTPPRPSYGGEARAQRDAYLACCASLD